MQVIQIFFLVVFFIALDNFLYGQNYPCPLRDCECIKKKADQAAENPEAFKKALDLYFAVIACDKNLRAQVEKNIEILFDKIDKLRIKESRERLRAIAAEANAKRMAQLARKNEDIAKAEAKKAAAAEKEARQQAKLAEQEKLKAQEVLSKIYFYEGRFGLASEETEDGIRFGFIDKNLNTKIEFKYVQALPFDNGFAKVQYYGSNILIDTTGFQFFIPEDITQLEPHVVYNAFDFRNKHLDSIPIEVFKYAYPQRLNALLLSQNQLKYVPSEIQKFQNLTHLDLSGNELTELPASIEKLKQLTYLDLSNNPWSKIPSEIGQLQNLVSLNISKGSFQVPSAAFLGEEIIYPAVIWELPSDICQLHNLVNLILDRNNLKKLPEGIGQLQHLKKLNLSDNSLRKLPISIGELENLQSLNLSSNQLNELPSEISQLINLNRLDLSDNPIPKEKVEALRQAMPWCDIIF